MTVKPVEWLGTSRSAVAGFPDLARHRVGHELFQVQLGLTPSDWKPMGTIGHGVVELRIHTGEEFRLLYVARFEEAIYVLHAFEKRSRKARSVDLELARKRMRDLLRSRPRR